MSCAHAVYQWSVLLQLGFSLTHNHWLRCSKHPASSMSSQPQPDVPVPMSEAGNQANGSQQPAPSNKYMMNVQQRAHTAMTMRNDVRTMGLGRSSGQIFTEAFKLLTLCTYRVHESSSQNPAEASYRRDLFGCCQYAFSRLDVAISRRLLGRDLTERVLGGDLTVDLQPRAKACDRGCTRTTAGHRDE